MKDDARNLDKDLINILKSLGSMTEAMAYKTIVDLVLQVQELRNALKDVLR